MGDKSSLIKIALVGVAGYLAYQYLQSSGLWAQWFGGNSFTSAAQLLSYCQANPNGTASFNGQSATCSAWLQAEQTANQPLPTPPVQTPAVNPQTQTTASPSTTLTPAPAGQHVTPLTVAQLQAVIQKAGYDPNAKYTEDQFNYFVTNFIDASAVVDLPLGPTGSQMTAQQYITYRQQSGVSGLGGWSNPYAWVHHA